jgi:hypothetical protein
MSPCSVSHAFARSPGDFWSTVDCTFRSTRPSGVSLALTALMTSAISSATSSFTSGTTFDARNRPSGSSSVTRSSVWMRGSAL